MLEIIKRVIDYLFKINYILVMGRPTKFNREKLVDIAMDLFWSQSYASTSIGQLVSKSGVLRGSLYKATYDALRAPEVPLVGYICAQKGVCHETNDASSGPLNACHSPSTDIN